MKITALILEDELLAAKRLKRMINEVEQEIEVIATYESIEDTANYLMSNDHPDLLFVDIHVADGNSFELFNILEINSKVIFTTAYDQYAIEAFRKNATDYLLKPLIKDQLIQAIHKAAPVTKNLENEYNDQFKKRFLIKFGAKLHSVKSTEIAYVFSKNKVSYFYTHEGNRIPSDYKMQELETMLDPKLFFRANRQIIIHAEAIESMHRHVASRIKLILNPPLDEEIVISTDRTRIFKKWMER